MEKVSLITTLYNEAKNVLRFLESYRAQTLYADEFVIVDGGSTDGTDKIIEKYAQENPQLKIRLIVDKTCSKKYIAGPVAKGRNIAIENAKNDYIAASDAGCVLDKNWFEEIIKPFEDDSVDIVSGWYSAKVENDFQKIFNENSMPKLETLDIETFLPSSRSIAFKKSCWEKVGGYPTATLTAEDTKFDLDLKKAGFKFAFTPKAIVYWECPKSLKEACEKNHSYSYGDGQYRLHWDNFKKNLLGLIIPIYYIKNKHGLLLYIISICGIAGYIKGAIKGIEVN